jgi:hypothetical protein
LQAGDCLTWESHLNQIGEYQIQIRDYEIIMMVIKFKRGSIVFKWWSIKYYMREFKHCGGEGFLLAQEGVLKANQKYLTTPSFSIDSFTFCQRSTRYWRESVQEKVLLKCWKCEYYEMSKNCISIHNDYRWKNICLLMMSIVWTSALRKTLPFLWLTL